jgi:hypothetical protein
MAICFQLMPKKPARLAHVDQEMCKYFEVECDPDLYYMDWFGVIGFLIATGRNYAEIKAKLYEYNTGDTPRYLEILDWLDNNYHFVN